MLIARRAATFALLGLALSCPGQALAQQNGQHAWEPAAWVPKDSLVHMEVTLATVLEHGKELALAQVFNDPQMQALLAPVMPMIKGQWLAAVATAEQVGLSEGDIKVLSRCPLSLSFVSMPSFEFGQADMPIPSILATLDLGPEADRFEPFIGNLVAMVEQKDTPVSFISRGISFRGVNLSPDGKGLYLGVAGNLLLLATDRAVLDLACQNIRTGSRQGSLLADPTYQRIRKNSVVPGTAMSGYCDLQKALGILFQSIPETSRDAMNMWGFDAYGGIGYGMALEGEGIRERTYAHLLDRHGWTNMRVELPKGLQSHRLAPAETGFFTSSAVDLAAAYDAILKTMARTNPRSAESVRRTVGVAEKELGIDFEADLLTALGPEYAMWAAWPGQALIPDLSVAIQLKPGTRTKLESIIESIGRYASRNQVRLSELSFRGHTIYHLKRLGQDRNRQSAQMSMASQVLTPCLTIIDGWVVASMWPQSLKRLIADMEDKRPRLNDRPDFKASMAKLTKSGTVEGAATLTYVDLGEVGAVAWEVAAAAVQIFVPDNEITPVDSALIPLGDLLRKHLGGTLALSRWTEDGDLYSETYSPTGVVSFYSALGLAAGVGAFWLQADTTSLEPAQVAWEPASSEPSAGSKGGSKSAPLTREQQEAMMKQVRKARVDMAHLANAIIAFSYWEDRLPTSKEWPGFFANGSESHPDPYLPLAPLKDPWGHTYVYKPGKDETFKLGSLGADGKPGGKGFNADIWHQ